MNGREIDYDKVNKCVYAPPPSWVELSSGELPATTYA